MWIWPFGHVDIFPKFKMAVAAILGFQVKWTWHFRYVDIVVLERCTKFGSNICQGRRKGPHRAPPPLIYAIVVEIDALLLRHSFDDVTRINFRFRLSVTWSSPHGRDASFHKIWCVYLHPILSYWHFSEIQQGGRRHLGFVSGSHGTTHKG